MKMALVVVHHDHAYVERRGGWEFWVHTRGAPARVEYRRQAIARAHDLYGAHEEGKPEPEVGGLGLLVLQRALLAVEDLGGMLHALAGPGPETWERLRRANI